MFFFVIKYGEKKVKKLFDLTRGKEQSEFTYLVIHNWKF